MNRKDIEEVRKLMPALSGCVYFDHAAVGPLPLPALKLATSFLESFTFQLGRIPTPNFESLAEECRQNLARLMRVPVEGIAFTKNSTAGINIAIGSIKWEPTDNVILMQDDFPSVTYPFRFLLPQIEKRWVTSQELAQGPEAVFRLVDANTRCVALSWVNFVTGVRVDICTISRFCRERGIYFIIDAMQGLGAVDMDFHQAGVDFVCSHGAKWMFAPIGSGFMYIRPELLCSLQPCNMGWLSVRWDQVNDFFTLQPMLPDARRYEEGSKNWPAILGLGECVKILLRFDLKDIQARINMLTAQLRSGLQRAEFEIVTPADSEHSAGIISCHKPGVDMAALWQKLTQAGLYCSLRQNMLRISPHFYNTEEEVETFLQGLQDALP